MKWLLIVVTASLVILTLLLALAFGLHKLYAGQFIYGIKVAATPIGGLKLEEAKTKLQTEIDAYRQHGLEYIYQADQLNLPINITSAELDSSHELVSFDLDATLDQLWKVGHNQGYTKNFWEQLRHLVWPRHYGLITEIDAERITSLLKNHYSQYETATASVVPKIDEQGEIEIATDTLGLNFNYVTAAQDTQSSAEQLQTEPIALNLQLCWPEVTKTDIGAEQLALVKNFVQEDKTLLLVHQNKNWEVSLSEYRDWLIFKKDSGKIKLAFDETLLNQYLNTNIVPSINQSPNDAKFIIANGRVKEFQSSRDGQEINLAATRQLINEKFFDSSENQFNLVVTELKAKIGVADSNDLGIREIIGVGRSNFSGSPTNRIHNIQTGAAAINGLIIKPGETFSLITALGEIDGEHGYLPELVIKGDETIAEYGGGLCQIGTTVFRAAIDTGLPIVERRNHSYRVSYYEPAGFDATIYNPKPDLRFTNDTNNNILIQTRIEGTELIFEYWGTSDGRLVEYTTPKIYNITSPGPTKLIETTELAPGEKKCTERAHNGADADFDYTVTYADGTIASENFFSHYVAWPEVCLIGVEPKTETEPTEGESTETEESQTSTITE